MRGIQVHYSRWLSVVLLATSPLLASASAFAAQSTVTTTAPTATSNSSLLPSTNPPQRVLIVGSSVADGWIDAKGGYLRRAFRSFSAFTGVTYDVVSSAVPGASSVQQAAAYPGWLARVHPTIVAISWGTLDDIHNKTPLPVFGHEVRWEIRLALQQGADVFVVTPPVTKASYTEYRVQEVQYVREEMRAALAFHSPYVFVFNVFSQMKRYLAIHNRTYVPYMANGWHPNSHGHALAGRLLDHDMMRAFPDRTVPLPSKTGQAHP